MNGRVEAAAGPLVFIRSQGKWDSLDALERGTVWLAVLQQAGAALAAADEFDVAHGVVRVRVDDALTDKVAEEIRRIVEDFGLWLREEVYEEAAAAVVAALREGAEKP